MFWCFIHQKVFKSLFLGVCFGISVFQTLKRFRVLAFGSVFWCFGVSDFVKFLSLCFWGCVLVFQCFRFNSFFSVVFRYFKP